MGRRSDRWAAGHPRVVIGVLIACYVVITLPAADDVLDHWQIDRRGIETRATILAHNPATGRGRTLRADSLEVTYLDTRGARRFADVETDLWFAPGTDISVRYDPEEPDEARLAKGPPFFGSRTWSTVWLGIVAFLGLAALSGPNRNRLPNAMAEARRRGAVGPAKSHAVRVGFEQRHRMTVRPYTYFAACSCGWDVAFFPKDDIWRLADAHAPPSTELVDATDE